MPFRLTVPLPTGFTTVHRLVFKLVEWKSSETGPLWARAMGEETATPINKAMRAGRTRSLTREGLDIRNPLAEGMSPAISLRVIFLQALDLATFVCSTLPLDGRILHSYTPTKIPRAT